MVFVGYDSTGSYKLYDPTTHTVKFSRDVSFDENRSWKDYVEKKTFPIKKLQLDIDETTQPQHNQVEEVVNRRPERRRNLPARLRDYHMFPDNAIADDGVKV